MGEHILYDEDDFVENEDSLIAELVIFGGLHICKVCGEIESGLENKCLDPCLNCGESTSRDDSFCSDSCKRAYKG